MMRIRLLPLLFSFAALPALAEPVTVRVWAARDDSARQPNVDARIQVFKDRQRMADIEPRMEGYVHIFELEDCTPDIEFKIVRMSWLYQKNDNFFDCDTPEVVITARMNTYFAAIPQDWRSIDAAPSYADYIVRVVDVDPQAVAALGETGLRNQENMLAAMTSGEMTRETLGVVSFYANENAALSRAADIPDLAVGYATLAYDSGFLAMGLEPAGEQVPLVASDPLQGIPVVTPSGAVVLRSYNRNVIAVETPEWTGETARSLRSLSDTRIESRPPYQFQSPQQLESIIGNRLGTGVFR
ncbi:hypothetical protein [Aestuariicoccus sp. MJ-SS9]|uniref:hypothetical protein n=1 Tax=Aestuariicoccus sp. MJ-SS9 TaxID=3079855 RepID=UPI00290BD09A|nr:hypothetical protein [Aestuariicoccus sp. MJ-SS9]MDU8913345.1 hypothetical protein [Aestuariicoccus sp. MJ-SS9]